MSKRLFTAVEARMFGRLGKNAVFDFIGMVWPHTLRSILLGPKIDDIPHETEISRQRLSGGESQNQLARPVIGRSEPCANLQRLTSRKQMKKSVVRRTSNRLLHQLARVLSGSGSLRPFLHRLRGVKIYGTVTIGDDVYLENEYPECIEIHDGVQISLRTTIVAHTRGASKVVIGKNVFIGAGCVIAAAPGTSLSIGEGSVLGIGSIVTTDVPAFTFYSGERAKPIARITKPFTDDISYEEFIRGLRPLTGADS